MHAFVLWVYLLDLGSCSFLERHWFGFLFSGCGFLVNLCNFRVLIISYFLLWKKKVDIEWLIFCPFFVSCREYEPIRLLSLQLLGRLLVDLPSEKKGPRFFNLAVGRSRSLLDGQKRISRQPIFSAMSDRLFRFPQTDNLCATLFDVLLGGASPKQVCLFDEPFLWGVKFALPIQSTVKVFI